MSLRTKPKVAPAAPKRSVAKRASAKQTAGSNSAEFSELLDQLAMHFSFRSVNRRKDAEAVLKILPKFKSANRRPGASMAVPKRSGTLTHGREKAMVKDDRHLKPSTAATAGCPPSDLTALLEMVLDQPNKWLATPNPQFGGREPRDLVGTAEEAKIFDLLNAVDQGLF